MDRYFCESPVWIPSGIIYVNIRLIERMNICYVSSDERSNNTTKNKMHLCWTRVYVVLHLHEILLNKIYRASIYIVYKYIQALDKEILELQDI